MDTNEKMETIERDIQYFDKMVHGAENLIKPWKTAVKWLIAACVVSNLIWGAIHGYAIYKAYQEPTTYEQKQDQNQKFEIKEQSQSNDNKGSVK